MRSGDRIGGDIKRAELELMIEVRDTAQGNAIVAALEAGQYVVRRGCTGGRDR